MRACVVGLPEGLRARLVSALRKEAAEREVDAEVAIVLAKIGRRGTFTIFPSIHVAKGILIDYINSLDDFNQARVIVLPYAEIPSDLKTEVDDVSKYGGIVKKVLAGRDEWPSLNAHQDQKKFQDAIFRRLWAEIFPPGQLPSAHLRLLEATVPYFVIANGALTTCDQIPDYRLEFIIRCGEAMRDYVLNAGKVGPLDEYFKERGLIHAKTGGSDTSLAVYRNGICVYTGSGNDHLKMGEHTTPHAATRFYFHFFDLSGIAYAALLYAGIHPPRDHDIDGVVHL